MFCQKNAAVLFVVLLTSVCGSTSSVVAQDQYELDNSHTSLVFAVSHFNLSYCYGRFNTVSGEIEVNGVQPQRFDFEIDASTIDTNSEERDTHLKSVDFFNIEQFPSIAFQSTGIQKVEETFNVTGNMTMLGTTKEVIIPIQVVGMGQGPFGKTRAGFFTKFTIKRSEFGMDKMANAIGDNISITFSFEGIKKEPESATESSIESATGG